VDHDVNLLTEACQGFVNAIVDDLMDEVVQPFGSRVPDIHGWPLSDSRQPFKDGNLFRRVKVGGFCLFSF
jgi:hypothetical protein